MKRILLDTQVLLWWLSDDPRLGIKSKEIILDTRNEIFISTATTWEISIKKSIGKLSAPENLDSIIEDEGFDKLPISLFHGDQAGELPHIHRNPFDRMLIAQAQAEGLTLLTSDGKIRQYPIKTQDAEK